MSTKVRLVVAVPASAGDINMVLNKLETNRVQSRGLTLVTAEGYNVDVVLESVTEMSTLK